MMGTCSVEVLVLVIDGNCWTISFRLTLHFAWSRSILRNVSKHIRYHGGQAGQYEGLAQAHITLSPPSKDLSSCRSGRPEYNAPRLSTRSLRTVPSPPSTRKFWEPTLYETTGPCCLLQRANVLYLSAYLGIRCKCPKIGKAGGPGGSGLRLRERW